MYDYFYFDFDGTLARTQESIVTTFHRTLTEMGLRDVKDEDIIKTIGLQLADGFAELLEDKENRQLALDCASHYRSIYPEVVYKTIKPFDHTIDVLKALKNHNKKVILVSSRRCQMLATLSHFLGFDPYVDGYVGEDLAKEKKPAADEALVAIAISGCLDRSKAIMVGDTYFDIKMGENANLPTCYCNYGYGTRESLKECQPTHEISDIEEILSLM